MAVFPQLRYAKLKDFVSTGGVLGSLRVKVDPHLGMMVVVVVAFSSCARILGNRSTIHSSPTVFFVFFLKWRLARAD